MADKLWLFRLGYLAEIFLKIKEVNMSLQEKQMAIFIANDKIPTFRYK